MNTMPNFPTDRLKVIREAAQVYYPQGTLHEEKAVSAFIRGAKWDYETMIEKACKVLKSIIDEDVFVKCGNVIKIMNADEFSEYFRKAMEDFK